MEDGKVCSVPSSLLPKTCLGLLRRERVFTSMHQYLRLENPSLMAKDDRPQRSGIKSSIFSSPSYPQVGKPGCTVYGMEVGKRSIVLGVRVDIHNLC